MKRLLRLFKVQHVFFPVKMEDYECTKDRDFPAKHPDLCGGCPQRRECCVKVPVEDIYESLQRL